MLPRHSKLTEEQRDLIERNWDHLFEIARGHAKPGTPMEEIYDAAVETAITTAAKFRSGSYPGFFSFCVDRTLFKYYRERINARESPVLRDEVAVDVPPPPIAEKELAAVVMATLSGRQRAVIQMMFYDGMSETEVARIWGCSTQNVRRIRDKALAKARRRLKFLL